MEAPVPTVNVYSRRGKIFLAATDDVTDLEPVCYSYGTRSKSYDAENRLHADAYPFVGVGGTPTSYGYAFGSFWYDETRAYEPPNVAGVDYDGESHPAQ